MTMDFAASTGLERTSQLEAGIADAGKRLDVEIARFDRSARRLQFWDLVVRVAATGLAVAAPVVVTLAALLPAVEPWWAIGTATAAGAAVLLERTLGLDRRFVIARTVAGRLTDLRLRTEYDLSNLPATHRDYHDTLCRRLGQIVDGQVDVSGEQVRAEIGAIWRIGGLGEPRRDTPSAIEQPAPLAPETQ